MVMDLMNVFMGFYMHLALVLFSNYTTYGVSN